MGLSLVLLGGVNFFDPMQITLSVMYSIAKFELAARVSSRLFVPILKRMTDLVQLPENLEKTCIRI
jgi:hypothetical protein